MRMAVSHNLRIHTRLKSVVADKRSYKHSHHSTCTQIDWNSTRGFHPPLIYRKFNRGVTPTVNYLLPSLLVQIMVERVWVPWIYGNENFQRYVSAESYRSRFVIHTPEMCHPVEPWGYIVHRKARSISAELFSVSYHTNLPSRGTDHAHWEICLGSYLAGVPQKYCGHAWLREHNLDQSRAVCSNAFVDVEWRTGMCSPQHDLITGMTKARAMDVMIARIYCKIHLECR